MKTYTIYKFDAFFTEAATGPVLKNFVTFTGERLCWILFLIELQVFRAATSLKRDSSTCFFPVKFAKFLTNPILKNICKRLLLFSITKGTWNCIICILLQSIKNCQQIFVRLCHETNESLTQTLTYLALNLFGITGNQLWFLKQCHFRTVWLTILTLKSKSYSRYTFTEIPIRKNKIMDY